ncbi:MAG TPA: hypothetical protein VF376_06915, partial [Thermoanaerobaculia bacterium]
MNVARPSEGRHARNTGFFIAALFSVIAAAPAPQSKPLRSIGLSATPLRMPYASGTVEGRPGRAKAVTISLSPSAYRPRDPSFDPPSSPVRAIPRSALPEWARITAIEPPAASPSVGPAGAANVLASSLVVFEDTPVSIPIANRNNQTPEPSLAVNGDLIFSTGNHYAQLSTDAGKSFSFIDPATAFPPVKIGFCGDQRTIYAP